MASFFCIYSGKKCPEAERSNEHIIPYSLGGTNRFMTRDVSRTANNQAGTRADGELIKNFFMAYERLARGISSADGHVPSIEFRGTVEIEGRPVRAGLSIQADGSTQLRLTPEVKCDWSGRTLSVACDLNDLPRIASDLERKGKSKGFDFKLLEQADIQAAISLPTPSMESRFSFDVASMRLGFVKMALGAGHWVLGNDWSRSSHAALLRTALNAPDPIDWPGSRIPVGVWPQTESKDFHQILDVGGDRHVVMVSNLTPLVCYILLFGKYDGMVQLAPGVWPSTQLPAGTARVIVVDTKTRDLWTFEFAEFIGKKQSSQLPFSI